MALSEDEERILAELEKDLQGIADSNFEDETAPVQSVKKFEPVKAVIGFFGFIIGLVVLSCAVYLYSSYGLYASVPAVVLGFATMLYSILKFLQSFNSSDAKSVKADSVS